MAKEKMIGEQSEIEVPMPPQEPEDDGKTVTMTLGDLRKLVDERVAEAKMSPVTLPQPQEGAVYSTPDFTSTPMPEGWGGFLCSEDQLGQFLNMESPTEPGHPMYVTHSTKMGDTGHVKGYVLLRRRLADADFLTRKYADEGNARVAGRKEELASKGGEMANKRIQDGLIG